MTFNCKLLVSLRLRIGVNRSDFAKLFDVSYNHIQKVETGQREPSLGLLRDISRYTGVPAGAFLEEGDSLPEMWDAPEKVSYLIELLHKVDDLTFTVKNQGKKFLEVEKQINHSLAVIVLQKKYIDIQLKQNITSVEKGKKMAALTRSTIREGDIHVDEFQAICNMTRRAVKQALESEPGEYRCKLLGDGTIIETTPVRAGIKLGCFDCEVRANEDCRGYGEERYPENIFMLVTLLEADGISSRQEQARIMCESFEMNITAHQLSEIISRQKHGKRVSSDMVNMGVFKRK